MAQPTYPDNPTEYMQALATILPVNTTVISASIVIEEGLETLSLQWPGMILTCPRTTTRRMDITGQYQSTFLIIGAYLDRWEESARTLEQCLADAKTALYQMGRNVRLQPDLGFDKIVQADQAIETTVLQDTKDVGLGFPVVTGEIHITVLSPWFNPT